MTGNAGTSVTSRSVILEGDSIPHLNVWGFDKSAAEFPQQKKTHVNRPLGPIKNQHQILWCGYQPLQAGHSSQGTSEPITPAVFVSAMSWCVNLIRRSLFHAGVIGSDVPWLECPACNALTWVITVTE